MSAAKKLNEMEQFFFDKNYNSLPLPTLAEKLHRPVKFVQKLIEKKIEERKEIEPEPNTPAVQTFKSPLQDSSPSPPPQSRMPNTQFNATLGRRRNPDGSFQKDGPIVMTESASMVGDEALKKSKGNYVSPRLASAIFKMRPDE
jgi:hypothetical protein